MKSCAKKKLVEVCTVVLTTSLLTLFSSGCASTAKQDVIEEVTDVKTSEAEENRLQEEKRLKAEREKEAAKLREAEERRVQQEKQRLEQERLRAEEERRRAEEEARMMAERDALPITSRKDAEAVSFLKDIHFNYDKADITSGSAGILQNSAEWLMQNSDVKILVEGHCDEKGTNEYNLALGDRRSLSVKKYLMSLGISGERISTISYGEEMPQDPGHDEAALAKNRRAHFLVTSQ